MLRSYVRRIREAARNLKHVNDDQLLARSLDLKYKAMTGTSMRKMIVPGLALVVEAARRHVGQTHYDVQILCALNMLTGHIAEMKTGEGKTLTASLPAYLFALFGKGVHVATFNDYLAQRDRAFLAPIYHALGLSAGVVTGQMQPGQRKHQYGCDITYASAREFGFDFLRDRLTLASGHPESLIMRGTHVAIIDEADSILIDEARTPLIIGTVNEAEESIRAACFRWAAAHAGKFEEREHFIYDAIGQKVTLTNFGIQQIRRLPQSDATRSVSIRELYDYIENAIRVRRDFHLDKSYAVDGDQIVIIDEFTGRPAEGRQWRQGIQQSIQAKEELPITPTSQAAATITVQSYFRRYRQFCGMTGTAWTSRRELKKVYGKKVVCIPTHRPTNRIRFQTQIFSTEAEKFAAIAKSARKYLDAGRAVLIGTRNVAKSEQLARSLDRLDVDYQILNARHLEREADIIAAAGQANTLTIATNMAGRGTDIKLAPSVRLAGGMHVMLTEIHEHERIDWQLIGRGARQGDPGSFQIFLSLDDEILTRGLGQKPAQRLKVKYRHASPDRLDMLYPLFRRAQRNTQRRLLVDRLMLQRNDLERQKALFATGHDPYLNTVSL